VYWKHLRKSFVHCEAFRINVWRSISVALEILITPRSFYVHAEDGNMLYIQ
jgi:hypothetical protein